jgi:hypothetical protein
MLTRDDACTAIVRHEDVLALVEGSLLLCEDNEFSFAAMTFAWDLGQCLELFGHVPDCGEILIT